MSPLNEKTATLSHSRFTRPFTASLFNGDSLFAAPPLTAPELIEPSFVETALIEPAQCEPALAETHFAKSAAAMPQPLPQTIQVHETVPDHLTRLGSLDAWRNMARRRAFDAMLERVRADDMVRAQCHISETWKPRSGNGERDLIITCDLNYWVESAHANL